MSTVHSCMEDSKSSKLSHPNGDDITACVLATYERLPQKCKPHTREQGSREWVPLAGIVLFKSGVDSSNDLHGLECVALGTGMKCLPASKLSTIHGTALHDSHAEVVAVRAFNRYLLDQCLLLAKDASLTSPYLRRRPSDQVTLNSSQLFEIRNDVSIFMYGSEAPCGDASMELVMAAQEDATPWAVLPSTNVNEDPAPQSILKGRGSFGELGIVRRKPARPDAPNALSKSCTDKITMYQYTSLLNSITSLLVAPGNSYLASLIIPESQFVESAVTRAFTTSGRLSGVKLDETSLFSFKPFTTQSTSLEFTWSRRAVAAEQKAIPSNISAVYTGQATEVLINGILQGRKVGDSNGASSICRKKLWQTATEIAGLVDDDFLRQILEADSYHKLKASEPLAIRRKIKEDVKAQALKGWIPNTGDENFGLQ